MLTNGHTEARKLRARLNHPIIDADGHWAEFAPLMREEFRRIGGDTTVEALALASQLVEHGLLTDEDFRDFMFTNAVRFWGEVNPNFFKAEPKLPSASLEPEVDVDFSESRFGNAGRLEIKLVILLPI